MCFFRKKKEFNIFHEKLRSALGGVENVQNKTLTGNKLKIQLKDAKIIKKDELKELATGILLNQNEVSLFVDQKYIKYIKAEHKI